MLCLTLLFCHFTPSAACAQDNMSDSIDVLHYDLRLDIGNRSANRIEGSAAVTLRLLSQVDSIVLELCPADVDSVKINGESVAFDFDAAWRLLRIPNSAATGDTLTVTVHYRKGQHIMQQGWGGFYFDNNIYYNLGIAIYEYPHNAGKAWFPCRDNFYDKATYHFEITAQPGWKAICTGVMDSVAEHADGSGTWCWSLNRQTPTYLVGVAVAPFHFIDRRLDGADTTYPALIGFLDHDSAKVWKTFDNLGKVIPMFERCFGPYRWDRVGYVSTPKGSMEHVGNVAFTTACMASNSDACLATMSHEFAHSWFGNLVTCASSADMWINEGGASFCEEVAIQAIYADNQPSRYRTYANRNLKSVLMHTHEYDNGFKPLYGQTPQYTYGSTVYSKGATVWHSLRGYVGDSLFYASLRHLFTNCAFQNIDSWQLRDSLSLYTGMDLSPFFEFHVFGPGFNDYVIDSLHIDRSSATVYVRQKNYGTTNLLQDNRLWITFFDENLRSAKRLMTFAGEYGNAVFQLPFHPAFAIVDYYDDLSKASVSQQLTVTQTGGHNLSDALFNINVDAIDPESATFIHVTHHWSAPNPADNPWIMKMADRFWSVNGIIPEGTVMDGHFYYCGYGDDASLDNDFLLPAYDINTLRLLWRRDARDPWMPVTTIRDGSSSKGYLVDPSLKTGEYTMAFVDTALLASLPQIDKDSHTLSIFPNPSSGAVTIKTAINGEPLNVDVYNAKGSKALPTVHTNSGDQVKMRLVSGSYIFVVRRVNSGEILNAPVQITNF